MNLGTHFVYIMANITNFYDNLLKEAQSVEDLERAKEIIYAMFAHAEEKFDALHGPGSWQKCLEADDQADRREAAKHERKQLKQYLQYIQQEAQEARRQEILEAMATKRKNARREASKRRKAALKRNMK
jgi:hypothetical protein